MPGRRAGTQAWPVIRLPHASRPDHSHRPGDVSSNDSRPRVDHPRCAAMSCVAHSVGGAPAGGAMFSTRCRHWHLPLSPRRFPRSPLVAWALLAILPLVALGFYDIASSRNILTNYPVIGHLRYIMEFISPEIRQYFLADDKSGRPFNRQQRDLVKARQGQQRHPSIRHRVRRVPVRLRLRAALDRREAGTEDRRAHHRRRSPVQPASRQLATEYLGDELRGTQRPRKIRAPSRERRQAFVTRCVGGRSGELGEPDDRRFARSAPPARALATLAAGGRFFLSLSAATPCWR